MSCTDLTDVQRRTLAELASGEPPTDQATIDQFRIWGWVMANSLELTGAGFRHAESCPAGFWTTRFYLRRPKTSEAA